MRAAEAAAVAKPANTATRDADSTPKPSNNGVLPGSNDIIQSEPSEDKPSGSGREILMPVANEWYLMCGCVGYYVLSGKHRQAHTQTDR